MEIALCGALGTCSAGEELERRISPSELERCNGCVIASVMIAAVMLRRSEGRGDLPARSAAAESAAASRRASRAARSVA